MNRETEAATTRRAQRDELIRRATEAGINNEVTEVRVGAGGERDTFVRLEFPNGRRGRRFSVGGSRLGAILRTNFEDMTFLSDYEAIFDSKAGAIEALLFTNDANPRLRPWSMPGAEVTDESPTGEEDPDDSDQLLLHSRAVPTNWRLRVERDGRSIELSPPSETARTLIPMASLRLAFTMKLSGVDTDRHDEAVAILERVGNAFVFELDVLYGASYAIRRQRTQLRRVEPERSRKSPSYPVNQYSGEALALYQYARAATGLPLLAFLAYYQSLEFFFPVFAKEQTVKSLRAALLNPRFDPTDDSNVNRLINLAAPATRVGLGEKDQLRATVRACVEADELEEFFNSSDQISGHFFSKKQAIRGVQPIRLQGDQGDLRDQVADRIYAIRCRVVHAKEDGGTSGTELLLPSSGEADSLQSDIELVRLVAQRALCARASRS